MRWGWLLVLGGCATGTLEVDAPADAGSVVDAAAAPDARSDPDARPPPPDAVPVPDATPLTVCEAAELAPDNDTCIHAIDLTPALGSSGAVVYGATDHYGNTLQPPSACTSGWGEDGPDAIYRVDVAAGETITAVAMPEDFDASVYILADCNDAGSCVDGADAADHAEPETAAHTATSAASYFVVVDSYRPTERGCFTLQVTVN